MDRLTHAAVGGPYSSRDDAERAIRSGSFDQDPAELSVQEGESDDGDSDDGSKEARKTASWGPFENPTTAPTPSPSTPEVPELGQPVPETQFPKTTKPAQTPGGGGGLPQDPASDQFTPGGGDSDAKSLSAATAAVVAEIRKANPGIDDESLISVASKAVRHLTADFHPFSMLPTIEDPMAGKSPFSVVKDVQKTLPGANKKPDNKPEPTPGEEAPPPEEDEETGSDDDKGWGAKAGDVARRVLPMLMV